MLQFQKIRFDNSCLAMIWMNDPPRLATLDTPPCKQGGVGGGSVENNLFAALGCGMNKASLLIFSYW